MANELDEITGPVNPEGQDVHVIDKQLTVTVGFEAVLFEIFMLIVGFVPAVVVSLAHLQVSDAVGIGLWFLGPVVILGYYWNKVQTKSFFLQLQQDVQARASTIDNYLEQRVMILQNTCKLVEKAIELDRDVMKSVAALRTGMSAGGDRNAVSQRIDNALRTLLPVIEGYPELKAHEEIMQAMQQNNYLQKEITAARDLYNDAVSLWNTSIYEWPVKKIIAARSGYTTRIPFTVSAETKERARGEFF